MSEGSDKLLVKALKLAALGLLMFPLMMTGALVFSVMHKTPEPRHVIFVDSHGMYEYDWDPTDPDFSEQACMSYNLREMAFFESATADAMSEDQLEKQVADTCDSARNKARKHRKLLEKVK